MKNDIQYFECSCYSPEHLLKIEVEDCELLGENMYVYVQLNNRVPFFKRIWYAIKYIFKSDSCCRWEETILTKQDIVRLQETIKGK